MQTLVELGAAIASVHTKLAQQHEAALCYIFFPFALPYADTSDCLLSSLPHPHTKGSCTFTIQSRWYNSILSPHALYDTYLMVQYDLVFPLYDTHLQATHTTTSSIGGVQIPIYLVSNTTDSL